MDTRLDMIQSKYVCIQCGRVYGPVTSQYEQQCECVSGKKRQKKWPRYDFNEQITLCYCCGQEALESGSRWSVWFCEECKGKVVKFNTRFQEALIPIGRHSLMSGCCLNQDDIDDPEEIGAFVSGMNRLFDRMDLLLEWRATVMRENIATLGRRHNLRLVDYLRDVKLVLDRSKAFDRMLRFFSRRTREAGVT